MVKGGKMKVINVVRKEIENTLDVERENALQYSSSISEADDIHKDIRDATSSKT